MENAPMSQTQALQEIQAIVVSPEEASLGIAEFWSGGRLIAFTRVEDGELALRLGRGADDMVLDAHALAAALAQADHLLALH